MKSPLDSELIEQSISLMQFDSFFHQPRIQELVEKAYRYCAPMEFFIQPASMSGKYHPKNELGVGGLIRHCKAGMVMARNLLPLYHFTVSEEDLIFAALALHDIGKPDKLHPLMAKLILEPISEEYYEELKLIIPLIESHMGQWDQFGKLPRPKTELEKFVHLCDYLASRKCITVDTDLEEDNQ